MRTPLLSLAAFSLLASVALPLAPVAAHAADGTGPSLATCGGTATATTYCSTGLLSTLPTGIHHRGGIDGALVHGPFPAPLPGYTGTVLSVVSWTATDSPYREGIRQLEPGLEEDLAPPQNRVYCHVIDGAFAANLCFTDGEPLPPHLTTFTHECYSLALGMSAPQHRGGSGTWGCAVQHSTFPCGGNAICGLVPRV